MMTPAQARITGWRQGHKQMWPIYDRRPFDPSRDQSPPVPGGTCPPHAPLTRLPSGGFSCVESLGQDDGGFTLTLEQNEVKEDKDSKWMPVVVLAGVVAVLYFWWRP